MKRTAQWRNGDHLGHIKVALAVMSNAELDALIEATYRVQQVAPGLLAWLDSACVWQLQHRRGYDFELQPPEAAIPPEEDVVSIDAAIALRDTFVKESPAVRAFFDALVDLLAGRRPEAVTRCEWLESAYFVEILP